MAKTTAEDPRREIVILTHHSPTEDSRTVKQLQANSPQVKPWAFGHTHYTCVFADEGTGKRVYTNHEGYSTGRSAGFREGHVVQTS
ncbi:ser/thr protein phosphatase superfamily [Colletotrichum tofieldiae]|nr:Ser/Thr protein phosphatase superfamily [Colletotrichum tofieldiae]GKT78559.1 ser/thr protein phosphatase superfamily [Colletotrichum tofieldiae]GKT85929.1 ser thr protein phosphatase superfamily [Colletotrichum tofieldiae]